MIKYVMVNGAIPEWYSVTVRYYIVADYVHLCLYNGVLC